MDADTTRADMALMTSRVTLAGTKDGACGAWVADAENFKRRVRARAGSDDCEAFTNG